MGNNRYQNAWQAFEAAWADACKVVASTMVVPSGPVFLLNPVSFSGTNCEPNIIFQVTSHFQSELELIHAVQ